MLGTLLAKNLLCNFGLWQTSDPVIYTKINCYLIFFFFKTKNCYLILNTLNWDFRMETLNWRSSSSLAKSIGTVVSILGAFIVTLYKGPSLLMTSSSSNLSLTELLVQEPNWVLGGLLLTADCVAASAWLIVQVKSVK